MKNILLLLFLFSMFLLGAKSSNDTLPKEGAGVEFVLQADIPVDQVLPILTEWPHESEACVDAESLARQFRICERGQRAFSVQHSYFAKTSAHRAAKRRLDILFHTINQFYTSLPYQSWAVSSDHYIFGMRHILI